jgi:hypothetical protein
MEGELALRMDSLHTYSTNRASNSLMTVQVALLYLEPLALLDYGLNCVPAHPNTLPAGKV